MSTVVNSTTQSFDPWDDNYDNPHHITPVPEPAAYGAVLVGLVLVIALWANRGSRRLSYPRSHPRL